MARQPQLLNYERAMANLASNRYDVLLAGGYVNFGYLTDFFTHFGRDFPGPLYNGLPLVRFAGLPSDPSLPPFYVTCPDEEEDAVLQGSWIADGQFVGPASELPGPGSVPNTIAEPYLAVAEALRQRGLADGVIGVDLADISALTAERLGAALPNARIVNASAVFGTIRQVKTANEIERLCGAVRGSERGHAAAAAAMRPGISERELAGSIRAAIADADTASYILHLSAGGLTATVLPPTDRQLEQNSIVAVDVGCIHRNYTGDKFHIYALGSPPPQAYEIHARLDEVNATLIESLRPGITGGQLFNIGRKGLEDRGLDLAGAFVGHGIGIDIHEDPYLSPGVNDRLEEGMVIVLEAGTRNEQLGHFCSEITCLITHDGCQLLTQMGHSITNVT